MLPRCCVSMRGKAHWSSSSSRVKAFFPLLPPCFSTGSSIQPTLAITVREKELGVPSEGWHSTPGLTSLCCETSSSYAINGAVPGIIKPPAAAVILRGQIGGGQAVETCGFGTEAQIPSFILRQKVSPWEALGLYISKRSCSCEAFMVEEYNVFR